LDLRRSPGAAAGLLLGLLAATPGLGQVRIAKVLSPSPINLYSSRHLVLIDFWATWCLPCLNAGRQLEVTLERFKGDLTVVSLTKENETVVRRFLASHPSRLTVALDDDGRTFDGYGVDDKIPYAVLLSPRSRVLWRGHPSDLTEERLARLIRQNKGVKPDPAAPVIRPAEEARPPAKAGDPDLLSVALSNAPDSRFLVSPEGIDFQGRSSRLIGEILKKSRHDIRVAGDPMIQVRIGSRLWRAGPEAVLAAILDRLHWAHSVAVEPTAFYKLTVDDPRRLWTSRRFDLGRYDGACLVNEESISVDNATIEEFAFRLSDVLDYPVYTLYDSPVKRDWIVHYRNLDLARGELAEQLGLRLELTTGERDVHFFK
jgi:thiol-disulfide isomerase/thioredoxin